MLAAADGYSPTHRTTLWHARWHAVNRTHTCTRYLRNPQTSARRHFQAVLAHERALPRACARRRFPSPARPAHSCTQLVLLSKPLISSASHSVLSRHMDELLQASQDAILPSPASVSLSAPAPPTPPIASPKVKTAGRGLRRKQPMRPRSKEGACTSPAPAAASAASGKAGTSQSPAAARVS
eukprot:1270179-Pleurochrysis_carterae.AAC.1